MKEYKCSNGHTYIVKDKSCLVCGHCTDVFWDYTNGPYLAICELHDELICDGTCKDYIEDEEVVS